MTPQRNQPSPAAGRRERDSRQAVERVHSPEAVRKIADRVYAMLLRELRLEAERRGRR